MNQRSSKKTCKCLGAFCVAVAFVVACGGRAVTIDDSGSAGSGATTSAAGTRSASGGTSSTQGGSVSFAGNVSSVGGSTSAFGGTTSSGGEAGSAGGPVCFGLGCPAVACGPNEIAVTPPGQCCPVCESTCPQQMCGVVTCPSGYTLEMLAGQCCPACVITDCSAGMKAYQSEKTTLAEKYTFGCTVDSDCVASSLSNACESGCSYTAIWRTVLNDWEDNLNNAAQTDCASCAQGGPVPPVPVPPCLPPTPPTCLRGQCTFTNAN